MLHEEVARFSELSGEDAHSTSISRIGGYLDGYEKGKEDGIAEANLNHNIECVDCARQITTADEARIRADERAKVIHKILIEHENAIKADNEASIHGDMFPKNVERFWQKMKEGEQNG